MDAVERFLNKLKIRYPVEPAKDSDIDSITQLYKEVSCSKLTNEMLRKRFCHRYLDHPENNGIASVAVCRDEDCIIGIGGMLNFELSYQGKKLPASFSIDLYILPSHQALGIGLLLLDYFNSQDHIAMDGNMNEAALKLAKRSGAMEILNCWFLRRWSRPNDFVHKWKHKEYTVCEKAKIDQKFDLLWNDLCMNYDIIASRDQSILKWRYDNHPTREFDIFTLCHRGELKAYAVTTMDRFKGYSNKGIIVDFVYAGISDMVASDFALYVISRMCRQKAVVVDTVVSHGLTFEILKSLGFNIKKDKLHFLIFNNKFVEHNRDLELLDGKKWHLSMGDSDFYLA